MSNGSLVATPHYSSALIYDSPPSLSSSSCSTASASSHSVVSNGCTAHSGLEGSVQNIQIRPCRNAISVEKLSDSKGSDFELSDQMKLSQVLKEDAVAFQADDTENDLGFKLREAVTGAREEAHTVSIEGARTKEAALMEREKDLRAMRDILERNRKDCQAWERRLRLSESQFQERERTVNESVQALEKALQYLRTVTLKAGQEKPSHGIVRPSSPSACVVKIPSPSAQATLGIARFTSRCSYTDGLNITRGEMLEIIEVQTHGRRVALCKNGHSATGKVPLSWLYSAVGIEGDSMMGKVVAWVRELIVLIDSTNEHRGSLAQSSSHSSPENAVGRNSETVQVSSGSAEAVGAQTKAAALMEREIELRKLQENLEQNRQDCQAWEDRLRMLESHLHEREEKINEREQGELEKALQHSATQGMVSITEQEETNSADARYPDVDPVAPFSPSRATILLPSARAAFGIAMSTSTFGRSDDSSDLKVTKGEILEIIKIHNHWSRALCRNGRGETGMVPLAWLYLVMGDSKIEVDLRVREIMILISIINEHQESPADDFPLPSTENVGPEFEDLDVSLLGPAEAVAGSVARMSLPGRYINVSVPVNRQTSALSALTTYSMTLSSAMPSIYSANSYQANFRSTGMPEPSTIMMYDDLSRRQKLVLGRHYRKWKALDNKKSLTWSDIPWPTFIELARPEELKQDDVRVYLKLLGEYEYRISLKPPIPAYESPTQQSSKANDFMVEYVARWHPDRLEVRIFGRVIERDREMVQLYAKEVGGVLRNIARADGLDRL
jgi:hypothetical protein